MKLAVIGTGYVGLVSGVCFADLGFHVTCIDKDTKKITQLKKGEATIYEPSLNRLLTQNLEAGRLRFSTDLAPVVAAADAVFLAVGTPPDPKTGEADLQYIFAAAEEVADALKKYTVVITKSTVPVGTGKRIAALMHQRNPQAEFDIASNPEFLREGSAVQDFMKPDRIVIGTASAKAESLLRKLYHPLTQGDIPILATTVESAEMSKYAANSFLATKVAFINEIADLCEKTGADVQMVAKAMGMDPRIGEKFLNPGPGIGGSCFPKDIKALVTMAKQQGVDIHVVGGAIAANDERKHAMARKIAATLGGSLEGKTLGILGITFKANTDDIRESPALTIVSDLLQAGARICVYDPQGMENAKEHFADAAINWCENSYECAKGADALVVLTEWNEFRHLDFALLKESMRQPVMIDLRNIYNPADLREAGFNYISVGR